MIKQLLIKPFAVTAHSGIKALVIPLISLLLAGCSLDASLGDIQNLVPEFIAAQGRKTPDFVPAEVVTSATGYRVRGVIGETTEKKSLPNGYKVEGSFYE